MEKRAALFEPHPIVTEFIEIVQSSRASTGASKFLSRALVRAAISLLPPLVRERLALGRGYDLSFTDVIALKATARLAERVAKPDSPPCQASVRLGLPAKFLYRSAREQERLLRKAGLLGPEAAAA
jgi:uncharacterized protein (DUF2236 family)